MWQFTFCRFYVVREEKDASSPKDVETRHLGSSFVLEQPGLKSRQLPSTPFVCTQARRSTQTMEKTSYCCGLYYAMSPQYCTPVFMLKMIVFQKANEF